MGAGGRILIVNDDRPLRRVLELNLAGCGYEMDVAGSGAAAHALSARRPDHPSTSTSTSTFPISTA